MKELRGIGYAVALMAVVAFGFRLIALAQAPTTNWGDIGSFIQGIVAIVAAVLTYRALLVAAHSADAAKVSADAAKIAADIAHESAQSVKRIERAYIDYFVEKTDEPAGGYGNYQLVIHNLGKTPAIIRLIRFDVIVAEKEPPLPTVDEFLAGGEPHVTSLGAGAREPVRQLRLQLGLRFAIYVAAEYTDIFGNTWRSTYAAMADALPVGFNQKGFIGPEEWNAGH